jgi:CDP-diacylglycerol---glycerol-3-phosphate 3-phosphatidyltransferase
VALNAYARTAVDKIIIPVARGLARIGVTANWLTFTGLVLILVGAGLVASDRRLAGAIVIASSGIADLLDGSVAKVRGTTGPFGAFYDSTVDRVADVAIFGAVAWLVRDDPLLFTLTFVALGAAQVTSYMRAKAESLGWNATVGVIERAERLIIILLGIAFPVLLPVALWLLVVGGLVTVGQRLRVVLQQARQG